MQWLAARDRDLGALRRACRTAIVMPLAFAVGQVVLDDANFAVFAAFGSFAMLMLVDFGGPMRDRLQAQVGLAVVGAAFIAIGTLASGNPVIAALSMVAIGFAVLFAGVVSSVLAGATTSLLLAYVLPVCFVGSASTIPDRLLGWGLAAGAGLVAIAVLWPAPERDTLRGPAIVACRALAHRLRVDSAYLLGGEDSPTVEERDAAVQAGSDAVHALRHTYVSTPYRPTGLATPGRLLVRLVDELTWLNAVLESDPVSTTGQINRSACGVKAAAATALERGVELLERSQDDAGALGDALHELHAAMDVLEDRVTEDLPAARLSDLVVTALHPSFRARELGFVTAAVARNIKLTTVAEQRGWWDRLLGREPEGVLTPWQAARTRAATHLQRNSVWLHNSVRGAVGLGLAVFVANETGVQHAFWVVLGTLSVLRSNALNTGQFVARGIAGTLVGFVIGAAVLAAIGTNTALLWVVLPLSILGAGLAPAVVSFAAGQAAFTLVVVILFNLIQPAGWKVGLVRIEDVALGCAVSLVVGLLFWPRGAAAALRRALATAYADAARYMESAADDRDGATTEGEHDRAAAASRRLDDAYRSYLAERGTKRAHLADVTSLVTGVTALRLNAAALIDLWRHDRGVAHDHPTVAQAALRATGERVRSWYDELGSSLVGQIAVPAPLDHDEPTESRLVDAVRTDLTDDHGNATADGVRVIWAADHLDAARRLQRTLVEPAQAATHGLH